MLSLYEILKASKTGIAPDMWTALAGMNWGGADSGHEVKELTGIPPLSFRADGTPLLDYLISGNTVQNGTPTPDNPVDVNGVGVRTENLWGETSTTNQYISNQGNTGTNTNGDVYSLKTFTVSPSTTYTFSWSGFTLGNDNNLPYIRICFYTSNGGTFISRTLVNPNNYLDKYVSFTIPNNCTYVDIRIDSEASTKGQHFDNLMLNTGSTPKPYEPYGYKIPISSGGVITNIYLGSTQTVRAIKKLVLTGNENWETQTGQYRNNTALFTLWQRTTGIGKMQNRPSVNTHFISAASGVNPQTQNYVCSGYHPSTDYSNYYYIRPDFSTIGITSETSGTAAIAAFKAWLADQYAAGTPVTVYYVVATAETAAVNEPLMKIGNYADTVSMEQAGVSIPTLNGQTVVDVETTLKPSQMYIKYRE